MILILLGILTTAIYIPYTYLYINEGLNLEIFILFSAIYLVIISLLIYSYIIGKKSFVKKLANNNFLTKLSHELRTPLNGILGVNKILLDMEINTEQKKYIQTSNSCGESLLNTVNDLLDFSDLYNNNIEIENIQFDIRKFLQDFYNMNHLTAQMKNLTFNYVIDPEIPNYLIGDPSRLRQVIYNLFSNSIKFTKSGEIVLGCKLVKQESNSSIIKFYIKDSGIGIEKRKIKKLFKEFHQIDNKFSRNFGGSGLGLTISKYIISLLNGKINVESEVNVGSTFSFTISLKNGKALLTPKVEIDINNSVPLIIDTNCEDISKIEKIFSKRGIGYKIVNTTENIESIIKDNMINLIIFNLYSIGLNEITRLSKIEEVKLLSFTSEGSRGDGEFCRKNKINGYFTKPFIPHDIEVAISIILAGSKSDLTTIHTIEENKRSKIEILIVDDNEVNLMIAEKLITKMGFHSDTALNGNVALEKLKLKKYDIIFMDLQMPEMNGLQTTYSIRRGDCGTDKAKTPIIALTANYSPEDKANCIQVGMNDFLTKPYNPILIEKSINKILKVTDQ